MTDAWNDDIEITKDHIYSIGLNDNKEFRRITYIGTKMLNNKPMLCFRTNEQLPVTINPSYVSFIIEDVKIN